MNDDDSGASTGENIPSNHAIFTPEKTCLSERKDASIIFNVPSLPVDLNQSVPCENENNSTDSTPNSTSSSKPSTSGKSKRRSGGKKHRAGRNQKRKWKPYNKLTWVEKQKIDERNARRAQRIRDEMSAVGIPVAPYNTSQFLINDYLSCHVIKTPDYNHSEDSSDDHYHADDVRDYYQQAFLEEYESMHEEYLNSLTHYELAEEWVNLEDKIEVADKQLKELREQRTTMGVDADHPHEVMEKIGVFRSEIEKLFKENHDLMAENEKLRKILNVDS